MCGSQPAAAVDPELVTTRGRHGATGKEGKGGGSEGEEKDTAFDAVLSMGGTPKVSHPFRNMGIFLQKSHPAIGGKPP